MTAFYSPLESQDPQAREEKLLRELPRFIGYAMAHSPAYRARFAGVDAATINSREALATLPITAKGGLIEEQAQTPPFGGYGAGGIARRVYLSPGPIAECDFDGADKGADYWKTAAALYAAGFRKGELIHNCFSYHFTPAGLMIDGGAKALMCRVFPGGVGASEAQARAAARLRCDGYAGTPDFLGVILDKADEMGLDISSLKRAAVSGGALSPQMRTGYAARGVAVLQWYGSADLGAIAFEGVADGGMVLSEGYLLEIVDPLTKKPLAAGEKGEVLITNFNYNWPLIRFSPGDLSAITAGISPCGRTNARLAGWLGRCDASLKVRGLFVHPIQIERVINKIAQLSTARLIVADKNGRDEMLLQCKTTPPAKADDNLRAAVAAALHSETNLRGEVEFVEEIPAGSLIEDTRGKS